MENTELYIKYHTNEPVPIDTAYGRGPQGTLPLLTVAHLVAACTQDQTRRLLGLPEDYGPLTLHLPDGVAIPGNTFLIDIQQLVGSYEQPLIIKSKNDMEVESNPTISDSSRYSVNKEVIQIDSIDIHTEHLKRPELLAKLTELVAQNRFVRLTSPAASGKSSLLMLYQHSLKKKRTDVVWISCLEDRTCSELLFEKAGIN